MAVGFAAWMPLAALDGLVAVLAGAFGAHAAADPAAKELLRTGAQYQLAHAAAALTLPALPLAGRFAAFAGWAFAVGGLTFGFALYGIALTGVRALGAVAPLGGLSMIVGWAALGLGLFSSR